MSGSCSFPALSAAATSGHAGTPAPAYRQVCCIYLLLGLLSFPAQLEAQLLFEQSVLLDKEKGLPTNDVRSVSKDENGFVWIGSGEGLCRFDGSHFRIYQNDPADSTSLFDNAIYDVQPYQGKIWVATSMGLSVLDPKTERFIHFQLDEQGRCKTLSREPRRLVQVLYVDPRGALWIGGQAFGVALYRPGPGDFQLFPLTDTAALNRYPPSDGAQRILSITASTVNDSVIYAGTPTGMQEINRYTGQVSWLHFPKVTPQGELWANAFRCLYAHDNGLIYCGSWRAGVHVFDPIRRTFLPLTVKGQSINPNVQGFWRGSAGEIWITTAGGLARYHTGQQEITFWKENDYREGRFYGIHYIDESRRVWFPALNGVHVFDPGLQQFSVHDFESLHPPGWSFCFYLSPGPMPDELLVMPRNDGGIYHFNLGSRTWQRHLLRVNGLKTPENWLTRGFSRAPDGTYTISADHGLFSYHPASHKVAVLPFRAPVAFLRYGAIHWDRRGLLWICAGAEGLLRWDPKANQIRIFQRELLPAGESVSRLSVRDLFEDSRGQIWVRREDGMSVWLPETDTVFNFLYSRNPENTFFDVGGFAEDRLGRVWVNSKDGWIGYAEAARPAAGIVKKLDLRTMRGLGEVHLLAADQNGDVWGCTLKELVRFNIDTTRINTLSFEYGVPDADFYGMLFLPNGQLALGGRNKIALFNPLAMQRNAELPKPYIEYIRVQGKVLPCIPEVEEKPGLRLRHWDNFFSIDFSAKAFTLGNKSRFRYRLLNFEDWQEAGERRHVNYTNVPGGDYVFQLQVANNEGLWSDVLLEMPVWVETAWWASWWFRSLALLAVVSAVYGLYRYRIMQVRRQERLRTDFEKKLANVEMSALLAQMNPHFLFNSLNSIDSYIIRNESKKASEYLNNFARLIRLILNNSRNNYINLKDELESLDLYLQMESLRFRDKFQYEIVVNENLDTAAINIPPMLIQPYVENAIWHGLMHKDDGIGKVTIQVDRQNGILVFTVEDNGVGRTKATTLGSRHARRKGQSMGMKITEDRIEIINKLYDANTKVEITDLFDNTGIPVGTRVVLSVPV